MKQGQYVSEEYLTRLKTKAESLLSEGFSKSEIARTLNISRNYLYTKIIPVKK